MTIRLKGSPEGLQALMKNIGAKFPQVAVRSMREVGLRLQGDFIQRQIQDTSPIPVDMGQYKASWKKTDTDTGCVVGNTTKQATPIEVGRKPGKAPPLAPLIAWAERHGFAAPYAAAVSIQRRIAKNGIAPRRVMFNTLRRFGSQMSKTFRASLTAAGREVVS